MAADRGPKGSALDLFGVGLAIAVVVVGIPLLWVLYVEFGGHLIGDVIERPPWSRTVRVIQLVLLPVAGYLAWDLDFRQFAYGLTAIIGWMWGFMWARALLRGDDVGAVPQLALQHRVGWPNRADGPCRRVHVVGDLPWF